MKSRKFWRSSTTHFVALVAGFAISFSSLRVLSSFAEPITDNSNLTPGASTPVAVAPSNLPQSFVATAIEQTGPAVVRIDTEKVVSRRLNPALEDPFFQDFFGNQLQQPQRQRMTGQGSGFIVDQEGIILTNAHVVDGADRVLVTLKDGRTFDGEVRGIDEVTDLAVVKITPQGDKLPVAPLGNSDQIRVGDWAIAVGNPVGLNNTVTLGIISTLSRTSAQVGIPDKRIDFIQTDAAINPGNSGGPLLNAQGEVIGINTAIRADAMGIGFAIPINKAKELQNILASGREVPHPYIGVQMVTITPELAKQNNQDPNSPFLIPETNGVLVVRVLPDTPAEAAGIRVGDVITKVNNQPITDGSQLQSLVEKVGIDKSLTVSLKRGDRDLDLTVKTAQLANQ
ncbi:HhoA/HhoB/HtrA family serine endopeptidase [Gloeocapsa sp. PCC 73106]|uniref:HhoA/HhoB/HtrA family serine endopeptidase n=1 Tax=Gloeocapsa sp. PCC 73106 TaxID=102232 RepID=UPI0002AC2815|nr:HhoA/HhoB/HtrA family serine endopeptidase [Gloeocapsa sp. PCC 73106]ELR98972.1 trypsin-like serine protease with C-terminal PDZ domain [Gloeocapsa sp. PCC 73106]